MQYLSAFTWSKNKTNDVLKVSRDECLTHFNQCFTSVPPANRKPEVFCDIFRRYRSGILVENGLKRKSRENKKIAWQKLGNFEINLNQDCQGMCLR